jgi:hypothetical protein
MVMMMATMTIGGCRCGDPIQARPGRAAGTICDENSGQPLSNASVVVDGSGGVTVATTTDDAGSFLAEGLPEGDLTITVTPTDDSDVRTFTVAPEQGGVAIVRDPACRDLAPRPGFGDVTGRVCNQHTGDVIQDATITITSADGTITTGVTDDEGVFRIWQVASGEATVDIVGEGYARSFGLVVPDEGSVEVITDAENCALPRPGDGLLSVVFCDPAGGVLNGALVEVTDSYGTVRTDRTDAEGEAFVGPLAPGVAVVRVTRPPDIAWTLTVVIVAGETATLTTGGDCVVESCTEIIAPAPTPEVVELMVIVDRSGSMNSVAPGYPSTRWDGVVGSLISVAHNLENDISFGLSVFPAVARDDFDIGCQGGEVVLAPTLANADAIELSLTSFDLLPEGATPTASALSVVRQWLQDNPSDRPRAVLLATDGGPNCNASLNPDTCVCSSGDQRCQESGEPLLCLDADNTVSQVEGLARDGVPTYVVGVPGVEAFGFLLDDMAIAGGTALEGVDVAERYYLARDVNTLRRAVEDIGRRAVGCTITLSDEQQTELAASNRLDVNVGGMPLVRDANRLDGFEVVDNQVELYGAACDAWVVNGEATLSFCALDGEVSP